MTRDDYDRYLEAFNARDYDAVLDHFADEFELVFAGYVFRTKDEVRRFYAFLHAHIAESVRVREFVSDGNMVALEADVRLEGIDEVTPEMLAEQGLERIQTLARGQVVTLPQFIHYHLVDGKIVRALCAVFEPPVAQAPA
ncbi:MAG: nuclear transport factor 2 family protein [Sphingomonadaceae bacterium]|nr:nuclear transport factor 2 family protein [Sphingomonadaceae bacterium]